MIWIKNQQKREGVDRYLGGEPGDGGVIETQREENIKKKRVIDGVRGQRD